MLSRIKFLEFENARINDYIYFMKIVNEHISFNRMPSNMDDKIFKFNRTSHDIDSLGVGKVFLIKQWLDENKIEDYVINDDLTVSMTGSFTINWAILESRGLPDYIIFKYKPNDELAICGYIGNLTKIKKLISDGANPSAHEDFAFRWACAKGYTDIVEYLLNDDRINPTIRNGAAIILAMSVKHYDVVKILCKNAQINNYINNHFDKAFRKKIRLVIKDE